MRVFYFLRSLLCRIGIHKYEKHWHKTQEGNFHCKYCGKFVDFGRMY